MSSLGVNGVRAMAVAGATPTHGSAALVMHCRLHEKCTVGCIRNALSAAAFCTAPGMCVLGSGPMLTLSGRVRQLARLLVSCGLWANAGVVN